MIGAQALIKTLVNSGVDVCFMNPGTSEMHFVHELDAVPPMRGVLAVFEGVATGAADATPGCPAGRRQSCCTWDRGWGTGWPTCTTPGAPIPRSWSSSART